MIRIVHCVPHRGLFHVRGVHSPGKLDELAGLIRRVQKAYPFVHPTMRDGSKFGVKVTSFGDWGWWSDELGFRYVQKHPTAKNPWPSIPPELVAYGLPYIYVAQHHMRGVSASYKPSDWHMGESPSAWFDEVDTVLVNLYAADAALGWHIDKTEKDLQSPIVTMSLGASARFEIKLDGEVHSMVLHSGDGVVMAGASRNAEHRIAKILTPADVAAEQQADLFAGPPPDDDPIHNPLSNGARLSITWRRTGYPRPTQ